MEGVMGVKHTDAKELPVGWRWAELKDICFRIVDGSHNPPKAINQGLPMLSAKDVTNNNISFDNPRFVAPKDFEKEHKRTDIQFGDVLLTIVATIGRSAVVKENSPKFLLQRSVAVLKTNQVPQFICFALQSHNFQKLLKENAKGTAQKGVYLKTLGALAIPLPPLNIQRVIVSKIEELFSELDKGKQQLEIAKQQLKVYRQAVLKWAFEGKLTNKDLREGRLPEGWRMCTIKELVEKNKHALKAGPFGSSLKKESYVATGYKIYGQEQVISDDAFLGDYYINEEKYEELKSCAIKPYDILISLVGTVGKVLILPDNSLKGIINPRLIKISLDRNLYVPKFFKYYFESSSVKIFYSAAAKGTTMDVLNLGIIKTIPFPLPSISEQHQIIQEIESRLSVCDKLEETINQSLTQAETLRQSILKKAFEGMLI